MEWNHLCNFEKGHYGDYSCGYMKFKRCRLKKVYGWTDGSTQDGRRQITKNWPHPLVAMFFDNKILKFLHPWWPCFSTDQYNLNNCGRGSPKDHLCQIIFKSAKQFLTRRFLEFSLYIYIEKLAQPLAAMFFDRSI